MTFTLHVDVAALARAPGRSRRRASRARARRQGQRLRLRQRPPRRGGRPARRSARSRSGTRYEVAEARQAFAGDVLVLTPWHHRHRRRCPSRPTRTHPHGGLGRGAWRRSPRMPRSATRGSSSRSRPRCTGTASRTTGSLEVAPLLDGVTLEGFALHLPIAQPTLGRAEPRPRRSSLGSGARPAASNGCGCPTSPTRSSASVRGAHPAIDVRPRIGTRLWLGRRDALRATGTVLDVHALRAGRAVRLPPDARRPAAIARRGERRHRARRRARGAAGRCGVSSAASKAAARGGLEAAGRVAVARSTWAASSAGSPSHRTCSARCCSSPMTSRWPSGTSSTATCGSPPRSFDQVGGLDSTVALPRLSGPDVEDRPAEPTARVLRSPVAGPSRQSREESGPSSKMPPAGIVRTRRLAHRVALRAIDVPDDQTADHERRHRPQQRRCVCGQDGMRQVGALQPFELPPDGDEVDGLEGQPHHEVAPPSAGPAGRGTPARGRTAANRPCSPAGTPRP